MSFSSKVASPSKNQVTETVLDILVRVTGVVERETVSGATNPAKDLHIDTDDLSVFIAEVEKRFHINASQDEWLGSGRNDRQCFQPRFAPLVEMTLESRI